MQNFKSLKTMFFSFVLLFSAVKSNAADGFNKGNLQIGDYVCTRPGNNSEKTFCGFVSQFKESNVTISIQNSSLASDAGNTQQVGSIVQEVNINQIKGLNVFLGSAWIDSRVIFAPNDNFVAIYIEYYRSPTISGYEYWNYGKTDLPVENKNFSARVLGTRRRAVLVLRSKDEAQWVLEYLQRSVQNRRPINILSFSKSNVVEPSLPNTPVVESIEVNEHVFRGAGPLNTAPIVK